jgi:hypothetical protein
MTEKGHGLPSDCRKGKSATGPGRDLRAINSKGIMEGKTDNMPSANHWPIVTGKDHAAPQPNMRGP